MAESSLAELKKQYSILEKKHKLPTFQQLNDDFEIDKITQESDCLIRIIRKVMFEKIVNSITFLESLINPVNTPRIYFSYIKSMSESDKKIIEEIYSALGTISLESLALEIEYSEQKEAALVSKSFVIWNSLKSKFSIITSNLKNPQAQNHKEKSYFG